MPQRSCGRRLLQIASVAASAHLRDCHLCEHHCGVDRANGLVGVCKASAEARVFRNRVEYGEEPELVPSHLFYLSGCDLRCAFCIAGINAFDPSRGELLTAEYFTRCVKSGIERGAKNIQWVGGEPTIHIPAILEVMRDCDPLPPIVWKSDFYGSTEAFGLLAGIVDVYVADLKFGNDHCARRIAGIDRYLETVHRNLLLVRGQGAARLIVRHLLLPGHEECCFGPIIDWLSRNLPDVPLSVREGYLPSWRSASFVELGRPLQARAGTNARKRAELSGLNVIQ